MASTLERIEYLEKSLKSLSEQVELFKTTSTGVSSNFKISQAAELASLSNNRSLSLEVSLTELAKTVTAIAGELTEKNIVTGKDIMNRILKINESEDNSEIENLVSRGILLVSDEIKPHSFTVVSHTIINTDNPEESEMVMERRLLRLPTPLVSESLKQDLLGRKIGDQVQVHKDQNGQIHILTIKEVYDLNEKELVQKGEEILNGSKNL